MIRLSLALVITAGFAFAESFSPTLRSQSLDTLQLPLNNMISSNGIEANVGEPTVAQVAEVISRVNDYTDTKQEIEEAIELARSC
jgi:hypothetical protein